MQVRQHCPARIGFTLIEMAITMLVIGILAAVAVPSYVTALAEYRARGAALRIAADLRYARSEAQRSSLSHEVQFDISNNRYALVNGLGTVREIDNSANNYVVNLVDAPFSAVLVNATFGADANVIFDMYGRPDSAGTVDVQSGSVLKRISLAADGTTAVTDL